MRLSKCCKLKVGLMCVWWWFDVLFDLYGTKTQPHGICVLSNRHKLLLKVRSISKLSLKVLFACLLFVPCISQLQKFRQDFPYVFPRLDWNKRLKSFKPSHFSFPKKDTRKNHQYRHVRVTWEINHGQWPKKMRVEFSIFITSHYAVVGLFWVKYFTHTCLHLLFSGVKNSSPKRPARTMLSQLMYTILPASVPSWPKILQPNKSRVTVSQEQLNKIIEIIHAHLDCINCSCSKSWF